MGGGTDTVELDKVTGEIRPGDRFLLCSDGLCKTVPEDQLAELLAAPNGTSPSESLVEAALVLQVTDNVTAVAVEAI